jgi:hypothetical protein
MPPRTQASSRRESDEDSSDSEPVRVGPKKANRARPRRDSDASSSGSGNAEPKQQQQEQPRSSRRPLRQVSVNDVSNPSSTFQRPGRKSLPRRSNPDDLRRQSLNNSASASVMSSLNNSTSHGPKTPRQQPGGNAAAGGVGAIRLMKEKRGHRPSLDGFGMPGSPVSAEVMNTNCEMVHFDIHPCRGSCLVYPPLLLRCSQMKSG